MDMARTFVAHPAAAWGGPTVVPRAAPGTVAPTPASCGAPTGNDSGLPRSLQNLQGLIELLDDDPNVSEAVCHIRHALRDETSRLAAQVVQLHAAARVDFLTGIANRRAWDEAMVSARAGADRHGHPLSIVLLDLDHFKTFNDTFGHQQGDALLVMVAVAWRAALRETDTLARYGGDEFAMTLPGCTVPDAETIVERMRAAVPYGQTCTAGIACWDRTESAAALVNRADTALYAKKRLRWSSAVRAPIAHHLGRFLASRWDTALPTPGAC